ncbi:MAG: hypothetical protein ACR2QO_01270 [Acidimicrobiales bacterium]
MRRLIPTVLLTLTALLALATPAAAQTTAADDDSVLVRVRGDVTIPDGETHGTVVVVDGDLDLAGTATTIVVIDGTATLDDATVETLVVISGTATLGPDTTITGDVQLVNANLNRDATAIVEGDIRDDADQFLAGFWIIGLLFMLGWAVLAILAALTLAAIAPGLARTAGRTITAEPAKTIGAGLITWVAIPTASILAFATIVGIPTALAIWVVVLPAMGFVGLLVAGVRIGEYVTSKGGGHGHPYLAAATGTGILIIVGAVPIIGPLLVTLAAFLGAGALALHAWRATRTDPTDSGGKPRQNIAGDATTGA